MTRVTQQNQKEEIFHEELLRETQAFKKVESCFEALENDLDFMKKIKEIRKDFNIPINGFPLPKTLKDYRDIHAKAFFVPKEDHKGEDFTKRLTKLLQEYDLEAVGEALDCFVCFNSIDPFIEYAYSGIMEIFDLRHTFSNEIKRNERFGITIGKKERTQVLEVFSERLPIAILINPYMSQRDIIDYVKVMYKDWIKPMQDCYKNDKMPLGKTRRRSNFVKKRNEFIYSNKDKSAKEIMRLVNQEFGQLLDYTYIQKVIRDEKEKREIK